MNINATDTKNKRKAEEIQLSMYLEVDGGEMRENNTSESLPFSFLSHAIFLEQQPAP